MLLITKQKQRLDVQTPFLLFIVFSWVECFIDV